MDAVKYQPGGTHFKKSLKQKGKGDIPLLVWPANKLTRVLCLLKHSFLFNYI